MHSRPKKLPSYDYLHSRFFIKSGALHWVDGQNAGKVAGWINPAGYILVRISSGLFMAHRIIYKMHTGNDPIYIDHIDGDTLNNDPSNLRSVTHALNCGNHKKYKNNTSGLRGVRKLPSGRYRATVQNTRRQIHLGVYDSPEDASEIVELVRSELGYTPRGG